MEHAFGKTLEIGLARDRSREQHASDRTDRRFLIEGVQESVGEIESSQGAAEIDFSQINEDGWHKQNRPSLPQLQTTGFQDELEPSGGSGVGESVFMSQEGAPVVASALRYDHREMPLDPWLARRTPGTPVDTPDWERYGGQSKQAGKSQARGCCCCALQLELSPFTYLIREGGQIVRKRDSAHKIDNDVEMGHYFIVIAELGYKGPYPMTQMSDCNLEWWERTSAGGGPQSQYYPPNTWYKVTLPNVTSTVGWRTHLDPRNKRCPGRIRTTISDRPTLGVFAGRKFTRDIDWYIALHSAPNCGCLFKSFALRLSQHLVMIDGKPDWSQSRFVVNGQERNVPVGYPH